MRLHTHRTVTPLLGADGAVLAEVAYDQVAAIRLPASPWRPSYGGRAKGWAKRMEAIQEILGAHQDSVVIREQLREMAIAAYLDGENAFTFGRLHALEQTRADATERDYSAAWDAAAARRGHRWLRR